MRRIILILILFSIIPVISPVVSAQGTYTIIVDSAYFSFTEITDRDYESWVYGLMHSGFKAYIYYPALLWSFHHETAMAYSDTTNSELIIIMTWFNGDRIVYGWNITVKDQVLSLGSNSWAIDNNYTIVFEWSSFENVTIKLYVDNIKVYEIFSSGFYPYLVYAKNVYLVIDEYAFNNYIKAVQQVNPVYVYTDMYIITEKYTYYITTYLDRLTIAMEENGIWTFRQRVYPNGVWGIKLHGALIEIIIDYNNTEMIPLNSSLVKAYSVYGRITVYTPRPINLPETPQEPELPDVPNPPDWTDWGGWLSYIRDRVSDFFSSVLPSSLSFLKYLLNIGSGIWAILGIVSVIFTIIVVGIPAVLGVMTMIYMIHGDFHEITKMWLFYIDFLRKIVEFMYRLFKALINVIMKIIDIITGPLS